MGGGLIGQIQSVGCNLLWPYLADSLARFLAGSIASASKPELLEFEELNGLLVAGKLLLGTPSARAFAEGGDVPVDWSTSRLPEVRSTMNLTTSSFSK